MSNHPAPSSNWDRIRPKLLEVVEKHRFRRRGWRELSDAEDRPVWEAFRSRFEFWYDRRLDTWPTMQEPTPSLTWKITGFHELYERDKSAFDRVELRLMSVVLDALIEHAAPSEEVWFLDLNHVGYGFVPRDLPEPDSPDCWPHSLIPFCDYPLLIARDLRFGIFGHPWEKSWCAFGEDFAEAIAGKLPREFGSVFRRNGRTAAG